MNPQHAKRRKTMKMALIILMPFCFAFALSGCYQNTESESSFQQLKNGDTSLLCPSEAFDAEDLDKISHEFEIAATDFVFEEADIDDDLEDELIVKGPDDKNAVTGVFNKGTHGIECWLWDSTEQSCTRTMEAGGVFLERYYSYYEPREEVFSRKICFRSDGQQGLVIDIGADAPRCVIFSSYVPLEEPLEDSAGMRTLTVYLMDDHLNDRESPIQSLTASVNYGDEAHEIYADDLNFDGYLDIYYICSSGVANYYNRVFLWDAMQGAFCENEALEQLSQLSVDAENEVVLEWIHLSAVSGEKNYYRYIDGQLTCVRKVAHDFYYEPFLSVEDYRDGALTTVFYETEPRESTEYGADGADYWSDGKFELFSKWYDINYHGE